MPHPTKLSALHHGVKWRTLGKTDLHITQLSKIHKTLPLSLNLSRKSIRTIKTTIPPKIIPRPCHPKQPRRNTPSHNLGSRKDNPDDSKYAACLVGCAYTAHVGAESDEVHRDCGCGDGEEHVCWPELGGHRPVGCPTDDVVFGKEELGDCVGECSEHVAAGYDCYGAGDGAQDADALFDFLGGSRQFALEEFGLWLYSSIECCRWVGGECVTYQILLLHIWYRKPRLSRIREIRRI